MQRLGENISKTDVQEMMREADRDLDGKISITEFVEMIRHNKQ
jgi:Ca2+-binding EF-hand superfamily protein